MHKALQSSTLKHRQRKTDEVALRSIKHSSKGSTKNKRKLQETSKRYSVLIKEEKSLFQEELNGLYNLLSVYEDTES